MFSLRSFLLSHPLVFHDPVLHTALQAVERGLATEDEATSALLKTLIESRIELQEHIKDIYRTGVSNGAIHSGPG